MAMTIRPDMPLRPVDTGRNKAGSASGGTPAAGGGTVIRDTVSLGGAAPPSGVDAAQAVQAAQAGISADPRGAVQLQTGNLDAARGESLLAAAEPGAEFAAAQSLARDTAAAIDRDPAFSISTQAKGFEQQRASGLLSAG